jgi:putative membrane protein
MHWGDMGAWGWGWGWLFPAVGMLVFLGLLAAVLVALLRQPGERPSSSYGPERILAERFARGEIDQEEYERRREVLR